MIESKKELFETLINNREALNGFGVYSIGVFGSFCRNEMNDSSDVDFLVEFKKSEKTYSNLFNLHVFLTSLTGRKVEILTRNSLSKHIGPYILKEVENVPF